LIIPRISKSTAGGRSFSYSAPKTLDFFNSHTNSPSQSAR